MLPRQVLVVDDVESNRRLLELALKTSDLRSVSVATGEETIKAVEKSEFSMILLDLHLPDMDGFKILERLAHMNTKVPPIIIVTADTDRKNIHRCYDLGAVDYLFKPIDIKILVQKVKIIVELDTRQAMIDDQIQQLQQRERRLNSFRGRLENRDVFIEQLQCAKNALVESEKQYRRLVQNLPGAAYRRLGDTEWSFQFFSDSIYDITGHQSSELLDNSGLSFHDIVHPDDVQEVIEKTQKAMMNDVPYRIEFRILRQDGSERWIQDRGQPYWAEGGLRWVDGLLLDITDARESARLLEEARDRAEMANKAGREFLSNMSHELRTPLHAILSFASFGLKRSERISLEKTKDYFERIQSSGNTLLTLVNELLDLAKLEAGKMNFTFDLVDANNLLLQICDEFNSFTNGKNIHIRVSVPSENTKLEADGNRLRQVLRNLMSNAVRYSDEGASIQLSLERQEDELIFFVQDEGPGIPIDELESVFGKFVQSSLTETGAGGTGLGLAICREIVAEHRGRIWAKNNSGPGAAVGFTIPIMREQNEDTVETRDDNGKSAALQGADS